MTIQWMVQVKEMTWKDDSRKNKTRYKIYWLNVVRYIGRKQNFVQHQCKSLPLLKIVRKRLYAIQEITWFRKACNYWNNNKIGKSLHICALSERKMFQIWWILLLTKDYLAHYSLIAVNPVERCFFLLESVHLSTSLTLTQWLTCTKLWIPQSIWISVLAFKSGQNVVSGSIIMLFLFQLCFNFHLSWD